MKSFDRFKTVDEALSQFGYGLGKLSPIAMSMVDEHGLRPGDPKLMRKVVDSVFFNAEDGKFGEPLITTKDFCLDEDDSEPVPFGYLEGHETYGEFDVEPWMGISNKLGQIGMVDTLDDCNFFRDHNDVVDEASAALCETNRKYSYEPVTMISSPLYKSVNDAIKTFEGRFQKFAKRVLVLGSGSNTLCSTYDFSHSHVTYLDESLDNLLEVKKRFVELSTRPKEFKLLRATYAKFRKARADGSFDLIIANNSLHWIVKGHPGEQSIKLASVLRLLADGGALVGVVPSLSGLCATPYSMETRNPDGLYCVIPGENGYEAQSMVGNTHYREPLMYSTLLYDMELVHEGRAEVSHLSAWLPSQQSNSLLRCYECFSFVKGWSRPTGVVVSSVVAKTPNVNIVDLCSVAVKGRVATELTVLCQETNGDTMISRTLGVCVGAGHIPNLLYHSPLLVSQKLDGIVGELVVEQEKWIVHTRNFDLELPGEPKKRDERSCFIVEVFFDATSNTCTLWWLETYWCMGKPSSWLSGLRGLPDWIGVKEYFPLSASNFLKVLKEEKSGVCDGVVILNPHDQFGGYVPKHLFFKSKLSVDAKLNGQVYEFFRDKAVNRTHDQNGSMRIFEAPFLLDRKTLFGVLSSRVVRPPEVLGDESYLSLSDVFSYPYSAGSSERCRQRNTALVQVWRGMVGVEEGVSGLLSLVVPLARHEDWGLFGVLENTIQQDGYDKDMIFPTQYFGASPAGELDASDPARKLNDGFDISMMFDGCIDL